MCWISDLMRPTRLLRPAVFPFKTNPAQVKHRHRNCDIKYISNQIDEYKMILQRKQTKTIENNLLKCGNT